MDQSILDQLLFAAIQQANPDLVENALKQGANPNAILPWLNIGSRKCTPFYVALNTIIKEDNAEYFCFPSSKPFQQIIELLLQYGATVYSVNKKNKLTSISSALPHIIMNFIDSALVLGKNEKKIMKYAYDIISKILKFRGLNSSDASLLDVLIFEEEFVDKKSIHFHNKIIHDFLCYGANLPTENFFDCSNYYRNLFIWVWPQLMVFYCLQKKNIIP